MSNRTDHAAEARGLFRWLEEWQGEEGSTDATNIACALMAQAHATAALVEQQRIANDLLREVVNHVTGANS